MEPRRTWSMARCLAAAISHAPGLRGIPSLGHCSRAATSASAARSSANPTSRTMRARPAISRADSMRQTASMARWISVAGVVWGESVAGVTTTDHTTFAAWAQAAPEAARLCLFRGDLLADAFFLRVQLGRQLGADFLVLEHLAHLDLGPAIERRALDPLDRFFRRAALGEPEAGDQLLGFGEGTVFHRAGGAIELDAHALRGGMQPLASENHARFRQ